MEIFESTEGHYSLEIKGISKWNHENIHELLELIEGVLSKKEIKDFMISALEESLSAPWDYQDFLKKEPEILISTNERLCRVLQALEKSAFPIRIHLMGKIRGLLSTLSLACDSITGKDFQLTFEEIQLGLIPMGGTIQRILRKCGALEGGKGLLEKTVLSSIISTSLNPTYKTNQSQSDIEIQKEKLEEAFQKKIKRARGNQKALSATLKLILETSHLNSSSGYLLEQGAFEELVISPDWKNIIRTMTIFLPEAQSGIQRPRGIPPSSFQSIGILGAGMMGAGIAYSTARSGLKCVLLDTDLEKAQKGKKYSQKITKKLVDLGRMAKNQEQELLDNIIYSTDIQDLKDVDLVIEAVYENRALKEKVTKQTEKIIKENIIFASNTSTLPISGLAQASKRPQNFIGMHFFSPVEKMQLVELILGKKTSDYALASSIDFVKRLGKIPIVVRDSRSFFTSRVFKTYIVEGFEMIAEGIDPALIELAGKQSGMAVGPLAVADELSQELLYNIYHQNAKDGFIPKGKGMWVIDRFYEEFDRKGKKYGEGFYSYPENGKKHLWEEIEEHFPPLKPQPSLEHLKKRLLYIQALESARCLEEKVIFKAEDADIGSVWGWGFPLKWGGAISMIHTIGIPVFNQEIDKLHQQYGNRFKPCPLLWEMQKSNIEFYNY